MATSAQQLEILFKKYFGVVDAYPGSSVGAEPPVSARPRVIPSLQVFSQAIPSSAPNDLSTDGTFTNGVRKTSTLYPHIVQYQNVTLASVKTGVSYRYSGTDLSNPGTTNILSNAVPSNFDPVGTYQISVYVNGVPVLSSDATYPWVFDIDAGYLTFFGGVDNG